MNIIEILVCVLVVALAFFCLAMFLAIEDLKRNLRGVREDVKMYRDGWWEEKRLRIAMCTALGLEWDNGGPARYVVKGKQ